MSTKDAKILDIKGKTLVLRSDDIMEKDVASLRKILEPFGISGVVLIGTEDSLEAVDTESLTRPSEKGILEFNLDEPFASSGFKRASNATSAYLAFFDIIETLFRPARKHGYNDEEINALLKKCGTGEHGGPGEELIGVLEERFFKILEDRDINMDDLD